MICFKMVKDNIKINKVVVVGVWTKERRKEGETCVHPGRALEHKVGDMYSFVPLDVESCECINYLINRQTQLHLFKGLPDSFGGESDVGTDC